MPDIKTTIKDAHFPTTDFSTELRYVETILRIYAYCFSKSCLYTEGTKSPLAALFYSLITPTWKILLVFYKNVHIMNLSRI